MHSPSTALGTDAPEIWGQGTTFIEHLLLPCLVDTVASPMSISTFSEKMCVETLTGVKFTLRIN